MSWTHCESCDCVYSADCKPAGSICDDLSNAMDLFPVDVIPTEEELMRFQCKGRCLEGPPT